MTKPYEPFRNAKEGDRVRAPQFHGTNIGTITSVEENRITAMFNSDIRHFYLSGVWEYSTANSDRALWYTNEKGELLPDRPKKMVEKVIVQGKTIEAWWLPPDVGSIPKIRDLPFPVGTPYKIIVEVEE